MADPSIAERVLAEARGWIGTPYVHQASAKGAGTDCLGLIRGVWRALYGAEPEAVPAYTPDWAEPSREEVLLDGAARHLLAVPPDLRRPGDVLVFRMKARGVAKHLGILGALPEGASVIHAWSGQAVVESPLGPAWEGRIAAVFRYPEPDPLKGT